MASPGPQPALRCPPTQRPPQRPPVAPVSAHSSVDDPLVQTLTLAMRRSAPGPTGSPHAPELPPCPTTDLPCPPCRGLQLTEQTWPVPLTPSCSLSFPTLLPALASLLRPRSGSCSFLRAFPRNPLVPSHPAGAAPASVSPHICSSTSCPRRFHPQDGPSPWDRFPSAWGTS